MSLTIQEARIKENLPHLFGWPWYPWAKKFFDSTNRFNFLVAANQISKSSTQIRKAIDWATNKKKWTRLWKTKPTQFWYLYPNKAVTSVEVFEKWIPEFLPRGPMKSDPIYGWDLEMRGKDVYAIHFNSGVSIYFKTYNQDVQDLQTATVYAVFADEEMPFELFSELRSRLNATYGYFSMVFTATLGQDEWRRTIEPANESEELFKGALKLQVSMYDCLHYVDGTESPWTMDRIKEIEDECATETEVQRRVLGRFVVTSGLVFPSFNRSRNTSPYMKIPEDWNIYTGVDIGSGGEKNHPTAITFVAVRPDHRFGIVFRGWRGDKVVTTSIDILRKHQELCEYEGRRLYPAIKSYDHAARDFFLVQSQSGGGFTPADKKRASGFTLLNALFKSGMLSIMEGESDLEKLLVEISSLTHDISKNKAKDDFIDSLRYACTAIPWNFDKISEELQLEKEQDPPIVDTRSAAQKHWEDRLPGNIPSDSGMDIMRDLDEWQELIDG